MPTTRHPLLLALALALCCTLCGAASRTLSQETPADGVTPAAAVPAAPRCEWYPPPPPGIKTSNWSARWPQKCMGTPVDDFCDAECLDGYRPWPIRPRIYCHPNEAGRADWALPIKGSCAAFCPGLPPYLNGVSWPSTCLNGFVEGTTRKPWAPPGTCRGTCARGFIGEPQPIAKCLPSTGKAGPAQWQVVQGACRDNQCGGLPRITWGRSVSGYWPNNCTYSVVGTTCQGICIKGYAADPVVVATCIPPTETYPLAKWVVDPAGACRDDVCDNFPEFVFGGQWGPECSNGAVGTNCTAVCQNGYVGDPTPTAVCVKPKVNETRATWVVTSPQGCKDPTACRDDPCQDTAFAIAGSCVPTRGEKPSAPGSGQYTCTCFDYYKWDAAAKACTAASLLAFAVTQPVDGAQRRRAAGPSSAPEASWIYTYGAKKAADIGSARWIAQDKGTSAANLYDVAVGDASTAWAVGSKGIIKRYDGTKWTVERAPKSDASTLYAVAALGSKQAWAGGADGFALYYDGTSWVDVSVTAGQQINDIAAVVEPGGIETVWAVAGDERNPNQLTGYIYKWDAQAKQWGSPFEVADVTLRGVTALDRFGAWAVGFTNRGATTSRGIMTAWDYAGQNWTRTDINLGIPGYARFNSITAINHGSLYLAGFSEQADGTGTATSGLVVHFQYSQFLALSSYQLQYSGPGVASFDAITGLSPSTTVAVGFFKDEYADRAPDGPSSNDWGYPAVSWQKYQFSDRPQKANVSIAYYQEVVGIDMQYLNV